MVKAVERPIASNGGTVISCISEEYLVFLSFKTNIGIQMIFRDAFEIKNDVKRLTILILVLCLKFKVTA